MNLEAEKRRVEDALAAERNLAIDKDSLLERSKKRELELEEEVAALHGDLDTLDSQLDRASNCKKRAKTNTKLFVRHLTKRLSISSILRANSKSGRADERIL